MSTSRSTPGARLASALKPCLAGFGAVAVVFVAAVAVASHHVAVERQRTRALGRAQFEAAMRRATAAAPVALVDARPARANRRAAGASPAWPGPGR